MSQCFIWAFQAQFPAPPTSYAKGKPNSFNSKFAFRGAAKKKAPKKCRNSKKGRESAPKIKNDIWVRYW